LGIIVKIADFLYLKIMLYLREIISKLDAKLVGERMIINVHHEPRKDGIVNGSNGSLV
jgi:hypothetical protein